LVGKAPICFTHSDISETKNLIQNEYQSLFEFIERNDTIENYVLFLKQGTYLYRFFVISDKDTPTTKIFHIISFRNPNERIKCHSDNIFYAFAILTEIDWERFLDHVDEEGIFFWY
jgi:hypothetical protein